MKEWAMLAIRNLLEDNLENQREIAALTPEKVVSQPSELSSAGVRLEINANGRLEVVKSANSPNA